MLKLNHSSLCEALIKCAENKNYKVVIIFKRLNTARIFANDLYNIHQSLPIRGVEGIFISPSGRSRINFKNGSRIALESITLEPYVGGKCNEVIYDDELDISNPHVCDLLYQMIVPYTAQAFTTIDEIESQSDITETAERLVRKMRDYKRYKKESQHSNELDEFLCTFTVVE